MAASAILTAVLLPGTLMGIACVVMFCDEHSGFPFGPLHYLFAVALPHGLKTVIGFLPGGSLLLRCCGSGYDYVFNKPNPLMQIFFLLLIIGGFAVYVHFGLPLIPNPRVGWAQIPLSFIFVLWVLFTFVLASTAPPGFITPVNAKELEQLYPYDGFMFVQSTCTTCNTNKVARSKHCRMLGRCVEKYDHFCPWINNCVGALNYKYFLLFVGSTAAFLCYGTYILGSIVAWVIEKDNLWNVKFVHSGSNQLLDADWRIVSQYMLSNHGMLLFILVLCGVMALTLIGFFVYQLWLIKVGRTANENAKWADIFDLYASKKWAKEVEARQKGEVDFSPDDQLISPNAAPLTERLLRDFPSKMPPNVYDKGFIANLRDVLFPKSKEIREALRGKRSTVEVAANNESSSNNASSQSSGNASNTSNGGSVTQSRKSSKKNKKKD